MFEVDDDGSGYGRDSFEALPEEMLLSVLFVTSLSALLVMLLSTLLAMLLSVVLSVLLLVMLLAVLEDITALVGVGKLDGPVEFSEFAPSPVVDTADEVGNALEVDSSESSDITEVVLEVDKRDGTSGRSTVTAAVVNAVVLPSASTFAVTATTTSAFEFVLTIAGKTPVP